MIKELKKKTIPTQLKENSGQDGDEGKLSLPPSTATAKITTRLQKKISPRIVRKPSCVEAQQPRNYRSHTHPDE